MKKFKIHFQDDGCGGYLGFLTGMILFIFDLQVTPILPTKFPVSWPFLPGEIVRNTFALWPPWPASWISDQKDSSYLFIPAK